MPGYGFPNQLEVYVRRLRSYGESTFAERDARIQAIRDRRLNRIAPMIPDEYKKIFSIHPRLPLIRDLIRRTQGLMTPQLPRPVVTPLRQSEANTTLRERWLAAAYETLFGPTDVYGQLTDAFAADGEAVLKCLTRKNTWTPPRRRGESPDVYNDRVDTARRQRFPFVASHVDTRTFFPVHYDDDGLAEVIEVTRRAKAPLEAMYLGGDPQNPALGEVRDQYATSGGYAATVEWIEWFNRDSYAYLLDGRLVKQGRHRYGRPPYFDMLFSTTSLKDPSFRSESIADPIVGIQDVIESMVAITLNNAFFTGFPMFTLVPVRDDAVPLEGTEVFRFGPSATISPPYGWEWRAVTFPQVGPDVTAIREFFASMADQVSLAPVLYGRLQGRESTATASAMISTAKSVFNTGIANLRRGFNELGAFLQEMVEKDIRTDVPVWYAPDAKWLALGPGDVKGYYRVDHELDPVVFIERLQNFQMMDRGHAIGAVSMRRVREAMGIEAPEEEEIAVLIESFRTNNPPMTPEFRALLMSLIAPEVEGLVPAEPMGTGQPTAPGVAGVGLGVPQTPGLVQPFVPGGQPPTRPPGAQTPP